ERSDFEDFVDALLSDEEAGIAALQELAGDQSPILALHLRDIILLGQLAPERIGVAFREFPVGGDTHSMVSRVRRWVMDHDYVAYSVMRVSDSRVRAIAITDKASGSALAVRLLPFIGNDQSSVPGTTLVYKQGGFWVYELTSTDDVESLPPAG